MSFKDPAHSNESTFSDNKYYLWPNYVSLKSQLYTFNSDLRFQFFAFQLHQIYVVFSTGLSFRTVLSALPLDETRLSQKSSSGVVSVANFKTTVTSGGSRFSRRGGRGLPRQLRFVKFVCQNERIGSLRGGRPPKSANGNMISFMLMLHWRIQGAQLPHAVCLWIYLFQCVTIQLPSLRSDMVVFHHVYEISMEKSIFTGFTTNELFANSSFCLLWDCAF